MQAAKYQISKKSRATTADTILDVAQELLQTRGYNGISYQDIADRVGIRKASIHHHFPTKAALGAAVVKRYRRRWDAVLQEIDELPGDVWARLDRYLDPFRQTVQSGDRACLCGVLGAEFGSLSRPVQSQVREFFKDNEQWLTRLLLEGQRLRQFRFTGAAASEAGVFFACLEGTLLVARACGEPSRFEAVVIQLKSSLGRR
jgi:TetR/AcrR family transcriptional repressor of nem operon